MRALAKPIREPGFARVGASYLVNELGNWLGEVALALLVFELTGSALATGALFVAMLFLPALITTPIVARIERLPASRSLPCLYVIEAAAFAALAVLASSDAAPLAAILILAAIDGTVAVTARALTRATAVAILTPAGLLREGNAVLNFCFTVGAALGPALAGLIVALAGNSAALYGDAVSFLIVALLLAATPGGLPAPTPDDDEHDWTRRLRDGLVYIRERSNLGRLLAAQAAAFVFFSLVIPIEVVFAEQTLDAGEVGYGLLLASWGAGMVAGSLVFAWFRRRSLRILLGLSTATIALAYGVTAVAPTLAVACAASVIGGAGNGVQWVALVTAAQELTDEARQARVASVLEALASLMPGIGFLLGGALTAALSPRASYAIAAVGVAAVLVAAAVALRGWRPQRVAPPALEVAPPA